MSKFTALLTVLFLCQGIAGCNFGQSSKPPLVNEKDIELCAKIYQESLFAIKTANEAIIRSTSVHTKDLARYFKERNQRIKNNLEEVAGRLRFELPIDMDQKQMNDWEFLVKQKGLDFDKTFVGMVSSLDYKEQTLLEKIAKEALDTTIRKIAARLITSEQHIPSSSTEKKGSIEKSGVADSVEKPVTYP